MVGNGTCANLRMLAVPLGGCASYEVEISREKCSEVEISREKCIEVEISREHLREFFLGSLC